MSEPVLPLAIPVGRSAPPFLAAEGSEVEIDIRGVVEIGAATIGRVGVKDTVVVATDEYADARHFVGPTLPDVDDIAVVVLDTALFTVKGDVEVVVELGAVRRIPGKRPAHALAKGLDLLKRRARDGYEGGVSGVQVRQV